jgi:hypothetical protein
MGFIINMAFQSKLFYPPFLKGGKGGLNKCLIIPLNPPLKKGDLKHPVFKMWLVINHITYESRHERPGRGLVKPGPKGGNPGFVVPAQVDPVRQ